MSKIPEAILQDGCTAYAKTFLHGNGSLGDGIEAAYLTIQEHDDWVRAGPETWTGKGLPPVDTVCIFNTDKVYDEEWHPILPRNEDIEVTIVAHVVQPISGMTVAVFTFQCEGGIQVEMGVVEMFKPKPSAEQIAAEERREAIESLAGELGGHWSEEAKAPHRIMATYLHDIGYRKQVAK